MCAACAICAPSEAKNARIAGSGAVSVPVFKTAAVPRCNRLGTWSIGRVQVLRIDHGHLGDLPLDGLCPALLPSLAHATARLDDAIIYDQECTDWHWH